MQTSVLQCVDYIAEQLMFMQQPQHNMPALTDSPQSQPMLQEESNALQPEQASCCLT
jgi:hypothetical protein